MLHDIAAAIRECLLNVQLIYWQQQISTISSLHISFSFSTESTVFEQVNDPRGIITVTM